MEGTSVEWTVKRDRSVRSLRNTFALSLKPQEKKLKKNNLPSEEILKFSLEYYGKTLSFRAAGTLL